MSNLAEILLAQIWNAQWLVEPLQTVDGEPVRVVYRGVWTHGFGPDFRDAMVEIGGEFLTGDIEIDLASSGWTAHGHHANAGFDRVILHLVARDDPGTTTRRSDGKQVPTVRLTDYLAGPLDAFTSVPGLRPLGAIGFNFCAPDVADRDPDALRDIWRRAGDLRIDEKAAAIAGEFALESPADALYRKLLDSMGFSANRSGMAALAAHLPWRNLAATLARVTVEDRLDTASALLLGTGGFLPLSPSDQSLADLSPERTATIERHWLNWTTGRPPDRVQPGIWQLARIRPASHPIRRLLGMAKLIDDTGDALVETVASLICAPQARRALRRWLSAGNRYIGDAHAHEIIVNVIVPFALAYGRDADQPDLTDAAAHLWDALPAGRGNAVTRRTLDQICGPHRVPPQSARAEQGLIQINRAGCSRMRCYECPVAHVALASVDLPASG